MKKTILALTIPALFATSASAVTVYSDEGAQVDIYGRIQYEAGERGYQDNNNGKKAKAENFGGDGEARLGVNVKYMLNQDVDLIGKLEWSAVTEGDGESDGASVGKSLKSRYAWAGFKFQDTTELTFGRSQDPIAQAIYLTDIMNIYGGAITYSSPIALDDKVDDQIRVAYAANGLDLRAAYAFADDDKTSFDNQTGSEVKENQWSASAGYTFPFGLGLVAAYEQINGYEKNFVPVTKEDAEIEAWLAGASYTFDGFYFAGLYIDRSEEIGNEKDKSKAYELHAQYNVDAWTLMAQYSKERFDAAGAAGKYDSIDDLTLGLQYDLTPKAKLYAEYVISDSEFDNGDKKDDVYGMGIQYNF